MIISFSLENWMSFREKATFSMVASRERQHGHRVRRLETYQTRILPIAAIYGGNASGKTNFFKALSFAKNLVVKGATQPDTPIPVKTFKLRSKRSRRTNPPSRFRIELLADEVIYEFSFTVNSKEVLEEKLVVISSASEKVLYDRRHGKPNFHDSIAKDEFLEFAFRGTRKNQLFLTNSVSQNVENFLPVYRWFAEQLVLVAPDSRFEPFEQFIEEGSPLRSVMNERLQQLDTGIAELSSEEIQFESLPLPESLKTELEEEVKENATVRLRAEPDNERYLLTRKNGNLIARKLMTIHTNADGTTTRFEIGQESDGSQRVLDLLPAFLELSAHISNRVYVIDEVDRSLHTLLIRELLEAYLSSCSTETGSQLLLTTHDVLLMDQQLLRRDEMWVAERDASGNSTLVSFSEYSKIRYDKDIRKSYLQGRLGGIPRILMGGSLSTTPPDENRRDVV